MQVCLTLNLLGAAYLLFSSLQAILWRFVGPWLAGDQPVVDAIEDVGQLRAAPPERLAGSRVSAAKRQP